jgi:hypothetical protein
MGAFSSSRRKPGPSPFWIPAFTGMTVRADEILLKSTPLLIPGFVVFRPDSSKLSFPRR